MALSPDNDQIALISYTRSGSELFEGLENLSQDELKEARTQREEQFQDELRTISIYDVGTGKLVKPLKLKLLDSPSRRTGSAKLLWNKTGLFSLDRREITIFNSDNWGGVKDTIVEDVGTGFGPLSQHIVISPDGTKYYIPADASKAVRKIPGGEVVGTINAPEFITAEQINHNGDLEKQIVWVGPSAFSQDSKKLLIQGRSVSQTNFMIWELNLGSGKTQKMGESETLTVDSTSEVKSMFLFLTYNPSGDRIIFTTILPTGNKIVPTDLFQLRLGEQKAELIDSFEGLDVSFLGWYLSK